MSREALLSEMQEALGIHAEEGEGEAAFRGRLIYSAAGRMALSSLWEREDGPGRRGTQDTCPDQGKEQTGLSVTTFNTLLKDRLSAFIALYPEAEATLPPPGNLAQEIFQIYSDAGFFYRRPYWIAPALRRSASFGSLTLLRDASPFRSAQMSGLGLYEGGRDSEKSGKESRVKIRKEQGAPKTRDIRRMFMLPDGPLSAYLKESLEGGDFERVNVPKDAEILKMEPPFGQDLFVPARKGDFGDFTLMRVRIRKQQYCFFLLTEEGKGLEVFDWKRVAAALLIRKRAMPGIKVSLGASTAKITLPFPLPEAEEALFRLLTWPPERTFGESLSGRMALPVYGLFRALLLEDGYRIQETGSGKTYGQRAEMKMAS